MRALALTALLLLVPGAVAAQDDETWPTVDEVRSELQQAGYTFGWTDAMAWEGGYDREGATELGPFPTIQLRYADGFWAELPNVSVSDFEISGIPTWRFSWGSSATALMEVASRTPADGATLMAVAAMIAGAEEGCRVFVVPGGSITVDGTDATRRNPRYSVRLIQGSTGDCP